MQNKKSNKVTSEIVEYNGMDYMLYSLYHHNVAYSENTVRYLTDELYKIALQPPEKGIEEIITVLGDAILSSINGASDRQVSITLTGGLDSRLILAYLLNAGIKPTCFCFGDSRTADVVISKQIAEKFGLRFHNPRWSDINWEWYLKWVRKTIELDSGRSHLHRAHRTAAIDEHASMFQPEVLFTGHMGGEGIRGLVYNNYFASSYFKRINETGEDKRLAAEQVLKKYFIRNPERLISQYGLDFDFITWEDIDRRKNKFFFLYDMVGKIHHTQDLRLYERYVDRVVSPFLDEAYLKVLFGSPFHMMARSEGVYSRLSNRKLYCRILDKVFPELLGVPLANGYLPADYLKGLLNYLPKKLMSSFQSNRNSVPGFSYGSWYEDFIRECSSSVDNDVWEFFDREEYMRQLQQGCHESNEGYWHRFSNPIFFSLVKRHSEAGKN